MLAGRHFAIARVAAVLAIAGTALAAKAQSPTNAPAVEPASDSLAVALAELIRDAIPLHYDKQKDWGATKEVVVGLRTEGKGFHAKIHRRKKSVNHGVWKHYKLSLVEPETNLAARLTDLRPLPDGRMGFTLHVDARIDAWARAKAYHYGVHLIALEMEGDMRLRLAIDGEVGLRLKAADGGAVVAVEPFVRDARLSLDEFHIRRVSNAHGPLVRQLSDGVRRLAEEELSGAQLTAKLNRAIEKKRSKLSFSPGELLTLPSLSETRN